MLCEQGSSTIIITSSYLNGDGKYKQKALTTVEVQNVIPANDDHDEDDDCPTPPRPKKNKSIHAGAAASTTQSGLESFFSLLQCQVICIGKLSVVS